MSVVALDPPRLVRLRDLRRRTELNGQFGEASFYDGERYTITLEDGGAQVKAKAKNLEFCGVDSDVYDSSDERAIFPTANALVSGRVEDPWLDACVPCGDARLGLT